MDEGLSFFLALLLGAVVGCIFTLYIMVVSSAGTYKVETKQLIESNLAGYNKSTGQFELYFGNGDDE